MQLGRQDGERRHVKRRPAAWTWGTALALSLAAGVGRAAEDAVVPAAAETEAEEGQTSPFAPEYGFLPVEILKVHDGIESLRSGDFNGDGLKDLAVVNNNETQITILLQRTKPAAESRKLDVNELGDSWRFEKKKIVTEGSVESLLAVDFDGDGKTELAWTAKNDLFIAWADPKALWETRLKVRLRDGSVGDTWRSAAADLNGDGKGDVVLQFAAELIFIYGSADRTAPPRIERSASAASKIAHLWVRDVNTDGRPDLVFWANDDEQRQVVVRFQNALREFGPEHRLEGAAVRAMDLGNLDGKPGDELAVVDRNSNRLRILQVEEQGPASDAPLSPPAYFGLPKIDASRNRLYAVGDINGDRRLDVVVADSEAAQMYVFLQEPKTGLGRPRVFPGLTGVRALALADADGDGKAEVFIASEREKLLAVSRWQDNRLSFPEALPSADAPLAMCFADLEGRGRRDLVYVVNRKTGGTRGEYVLRKLKYDREERSWVAGEMGMQAEVLLEGVRNAPAELIPYDADRDGLEDLLVLSPKSPITFLATDDRGLPQLVAAGQGERLGSLDPGQVTVGELDGPAILVAQKNFARRVALDARRQVKVTDQFNTESPSAEVSAVQILDLDGDKKPEIVLADIGTKRLRFLKLKEGVYRPWKDLEFDFTAFRSLIPGDFDGDGTTDLLLARADDFAIVYGGKAGPRLRDLGDFESKLKDARFMDLIIGDLGGKNEPEVGLIDSEKHRLQLVAEREGTWQGMLSFKVFETGPKTPGGGQPREMLVADVTGDGLDDLILMVYERLLIYPQDSGSPAASAK